MPASPTFLIFEDRVADGSMPRAVIFGAGHGSTYPDKDSSGCTSAADAIRAASQDDAALVEHWDFDLGGPVSTVTRALASTREASRPSCATMPIIEHGSRRRRARSWHWRLCLSCLAELFRHRSRSRRLFESGADLGPADRRSLSTARRGKWRALRVFESDPPSEGDAACRRHSAGRPSERRERAPRRCRSSATLWQPLRDCPRGSRPRS